MYGMIGREYDTAAFGDKPRRVNAWKEFELYQELKDQCTC